MNKNIYLLPLILTIISISNSIRIEENDKDLQNNFNDDEDYFDRRKRPTSGSGCNFKKKKPIKVYKTDGSGRTFLDLIFVNVDNNYEYNVNCGGNTNPQRPHHKPSPGGHHKPGFGGSHKPGHHLHNSEMESDTGEHTGNRPYRPFLAMLVGNRPFQNLFGQSPESSNDATNPQHSGVLGNIASSFGSILPSPQDFGQGLGDGIASFIQTIPQIGQSFQSLLPDFSNFQLPFFGGSTAQNVPDPTYSPTDDLIDETTSDNLKPVHEDHDLVTDPYKNRLPFGAKGYHRNFGRTFNKNNNNILSENGNNFNEETISRSLNAQNANAGSEETNKIRFPS